jgi:mannose-6-phosphate isomerase-like protein (cupin superfamily)
VEDEMSASQQIDASTRSTGGAEAPEYPHVDPEHRAAYRFGRRGDDLLVATELRPGALLPKHKHPVQREIWWVEEGEAEIFFAGRWRRATAASGRFDVVAGMVHGLRNRGSAPARLGTEVIPAGDLEAFLVESSWASREGLVKRGGVPGSLAGLGWAARFLHRHSEETVMSFPPPPAIKLLGLFRGVGDAEYPGHSR